jgi:glutaredoxin 3
MKNNINKLGNGDFEVKPMSAVDIDDEQNKTIIWSKDYCGYCTMAKGLMDKHGVKYEERNLSTDEWDMEQLLSVVPGVRTMPQVFMDGKHIGGFDDLDAYMFLKFEDEE